MKWVALDPFRTSTVAQHFSTVAVPMQDASTPPSEEKLDRQPTKLSLKITVEEFLYETSELMRAVLAEKLSLVIARALEEDKSVFLDSLGLVSPWIAERPTTEVLSKKYIFSLDTIASATFEKCDDPVACPDRGRRKVLESADLAREIWPLLPPTIRWDERETKRYIKGFCLWLRREVLNSGQSNRLEEIGTFYSLHSRQGDTEADWYSCADIFLVPRFRKVLSSQSRRVCDRPILRDAWEIFQACYGAPESTFVVKPAELLPTLGYEVTPSSDELPEIAVAVFAHQIGTKDVWSFVTDNFRQRGIALYGHGNEIVCRFEADAHLTRDQAQQISSKLIALSFLLSESTASRNLRIGSGLHSAESLAPDSVGNWNGLLISKFSDLPFQQLSEQGPFTFVSIAMLQDDEYEIAQSLGAGCLTAILERRGLTSINRLSRGSLVTRRLRNGATNKLIP